MSAAFHRPLTYADAARRADDITVDELEALIRADTEVHLYPAPRRWTWRIEHVSVLRGRDGYATVGFDRRAADNRTRVSKYLSLFAAPRDAAPIFAFCDSERVVRVIRGD